MKKYFMIILMIIYSTVSRGQEENKYSIGLDANYLYHNIGGDTGNNFNYGFSLLLAEKIAKIKVGIGINFSTLNYTDNPNYANKLEYKIKYLNFPLLVFFNNNSIKSTKISPYVGIIVNKVIRYDQVSYHPNTAPTYQKDINLPRKLGFTFRAGVNVSKTISRNVVLNIAPFADFKFVTNGYHSSAYDELPDSGLTFGFKVGFDYNL